MLNYIPDIYPDELFYSYICRIYQHNGFFQYQKQFAEELFGDGYLALNKCFCNNVKEPYRDIIRGDTPYGIFLEEHTLFRFYTRYYSLEKKHDSQLMLTEKPTQLNKRLKSVIRMDSQKEERLKFCPQCVREDREFYGETYWHTIHQVPYLHICPKHGCSLAISGVTIRTVQEPLMPAEQNIAGETEYYDDGQPPAFAEYLSRLAAEPLDRQREAVYRDILLEFLTKAGYTYPLSDTIQIARLAEDLTKFQGKSGIGPDKPWTRDRLERVLGLIRINPYDISLLAYFLHIPAERLIHPEKHPEVTRETVKRVIPMLVKLGKSYRQVSQFLDIPLETIQNVSEEAGAFSQTKHPPGEKDTGRIEKERKFWLSLLETRPKDTYAELCAISPEVRKRLRWLRENDREWAMEHMPKKKPPGIKVDYQALDEAYCIKVPEIVRKLKEDSGQVPIRITKKAIVKLLDERITGRPGKFPHTIKEIDKYVQTPGEYFARKLEWVIRHKFQEHETINFSQLKRRASISQKQLIRYKAEIEQICSPETVFIYHNLF